MLCSDAQTRAGTCCTYALVHRVSLQHLDRQFVFRSSTPLIRLFKFCPGQSQPSCVSQGSRTSSRQLVLTAENPDGASWKSSRAQELLIEPAGGDDGWIPPQILTIKQKCSVCRKSPFCNFGSHGLGYQHALTMDLKARYSLRQ